MAQLMLWLCIGIFGTIGSIIPWLMGSDGLLWPIILSTLGSLVGIWVWYRWLRFV